MLRQLPGDTEATGLGKFSNQSPRYRDITSRELASADHPRFGPLRPSAIHSTPTLTQLRKQRKRKSVAVVLGEVQSSSAADAPVSISRNSQQEEQTKTKGKI